MSLTAIATFIRFKDEKGGLKYRYQNAVPGKTIFFGGQDYYYLSYIYQGAAKTRTGDNLQSALVLSANWLSQGTAQKARRRELARRGVHRRNEARLLRSGQNTNPRKLDCLHDELRQHQRGNHFEQRHRCSRS